MRTLFACLVVALIPMPVLAAEFYIIQDTEKQTCTVVQEQPKEDRHVIVGDGAYNDESSATSDMLKMFVCNPVDPRRDAPQGPTESKTQ
jgi:hypothetical protein